MTATTQGKFTGYHMTAILVVFFGIVIAVNITMARYAIGTFGGTVVDNSYVASQRYNGWLAEADRQDRLGWTSKVALSAGRKVEVTVSKAGQALPGLEVTGVARHPLGQSPDLPLRFALGEDGVLRSLTSLPQGRWNVALSLHSGGNTFKLAHILQ